MKEALIIFIVLLILLMIISVFGGSIRYTPSTYAGVPSSPVTGMPGAGSIRGLGGSAPMPTSWEGFDAVSVGKAPGASSSPSASSASSGSANVASSPAGNSMGAVKSSAAPTMPSMAAAHPPALPTSPTMVEPFGSPEFAPF
jgi:hypothetical protein